MREFEVHFANKAAGPSGHPEKVITEIGGESWRMKREAAIAWLAVDANTFYVKSGEQRIYLVVATHNGESWLRTNKDWAQTNTLLDLPNCPAKFGE